jgi:hypothetical protein
MRSALFRYITQRRVVMLYRRFGTSYGFHQLMQTIRCPETSANDYHSTLRNIPKERRGRNSGSSLKSRKRNEFLRWRWGWRYRSTQWSLDLGEGIHMCIGWEAGWVPEPVWTFKRRSLACAGIRTLDRSFRSQSLYRKRNCGAGRILWTWCFIIVCSVCPYKSITVGNCPPSVEPWGT